MKADNKEWADEESGGNASAGSSRPRPALTYGDEDDQPAKRARTSVSYCARIRRQANDQAPRAAADGDVMRCNCELEAKFGVASKEGPNKGRKFW